MTMNVPFVRPAMPPAEEMSELFRRISDANWYTNFGPMEQRFRSAIAEYLGRDVHVSTVANATVGLMGALSAMLPKGDDSACIAIASFTFAPGPPPITLHRYSPPSLD